MASHDNKFYVWSKKYFSIRKDLEGHSFSLD